MKLKIAIIGTRGIPNRYGGFEQAAQFIATGLVKKGHEVTVYNSHLHPYKENNWEGVTIIRCRDAENWLGSFGQFIYDLNCIRHARKKQFDVWLFFGYTSSSIWKNLYSNKAVIISNMDGLEWKRSKYSKPVQRFLLYAEKLAVKHSDACIADSIAIQDYLQNKYPINTEYIPYGAEINDNTNDRLLERFAIIKKKFFLLIARMEPENNIGVILDGFHKARSENKFVIVSNTNNSYGRKLLNKFKNDDRVIFAGAIFDPILIRTLRSNCAAYFHGHSVGGTNPSLLEAMADKTLIIAHDNPFNKAVLGDDAYYFIDPADIKELIERTDLIEKSKTKIELNFQKINSIYNWEKVTDHYEAFIKQAYTHRNK